MIPRSRTETFAFFAKAENLQRLTPKSLKFKIHSALPIDMHAGTLIDYQLALFGIPFRWRTRIEEFEPESRFVDVQLAGPYRYWRHLHEFQEVPGGTMVHDCVDYELPLGPLGDLAHTLFVRRQLKHIFDFRHQALLAIFQT
jgi:ligand-binding SRPBCC domain-containing protein